MNIILCGFMGCGKSTIGRRAAQKLKLEFVDMDSFIEESAGMSVSEIFEKYGEEEFRRMETDAARKLSEGNNRIIATGGGAVLNPENVRLLKSNGVIIMLQVSPDTVLYRLRNNTTRPLLQREDKEAAVRELMKNRNPVYRQAASVIINANLPSAQVAVQVCHFAKNYIDKPPVTVL